MDKRGMKKMSGSEEDNNSRIGGPSGTVASQETRNQKAKAKPSEKSTPKGAKR